ncbi:MAG: hypothetical protein ACTSWR_04075 [Candidatus Helarchaeota archaeon]
MFGYTLFTGYKQPYRAPLSSQFFNDKCYFLTYNIYYLVGNNQPGKLDNQILELKPSITASNSFVDELASLELRYKKLLNVYNNHK